MSVRFPRTTSSTTAVSGWPCATASVVAHAADPEALQANPAVLSTDDVFPVGDPPSGFYTVNA